MIYADLEFLGEELMDALKYLEIKYEKSPAHRHNKRGVVEKTNADFRILVQEIINDSNSSKRNMD